MSSERRRCYHCEGTSCGCPKCIRCGRKVTDFYGRGDYCSERCRDYACRECAKKDEEITRLRAELEKHIPPEHSFDGWLAALFQDKGKYSWAPLDKTIVFVQTTDDASAARRILPTAMVYIWGETVPVGLQPRMLLLIGIDKIENEDRTWNRIVVMFWVHSGALYDVDRHGVPLKRIDATALQTDIATKGIHHISSP